MVHWRNFPGRVVAWLLSFFLWYQIFVGAFIGTVSDLHPAWHTVILIIWNAVYLLTISSLLAAALTEPAPIDSRFQVPDRFLQIPFEDREEAYYQQLSDYATAHPEIPYQWMETGDLKYPRHCDKCHVFKPPRAHHCRSCGKCILRMDHHCPVIGTCIHFHNHKYFLLFLFWAFILCLMATVLMTPSICKIFTTLYEHVLFSQSIPALIVMSGYSNAMICGIALLVFQVQLWWMLKRNQTTLEASHEDDDSKPSYDLGSAAANIQSIFGKNWRLWLLPVPSTIGDGFSYTQNIQNSADD